MKKNSSLLFVILLFIASQILAQPASFVPRGVGGGGSMFFPRINPANDNEYYVACDMSEFFHSTDFGNSYSQIHFSKLQSLNVSTYEFTHDPNIAYSNFNDGNNGYPVKTTDGGNNWTQLPGFNSANGEVWAMAVNYYDSAQLVMNYYGSIVFSNDGGNTFQTVKNATINTLGIRICGTFFDGSNIYIGTNEGILYSTNGGISFNTMPTSGIAAGQTLLSFSGAKAGSATRFVCVTAGSSSVYCGLMPYDYNGLVSGVYIMDNAGGTWVSKSSGINFLNDNIMYSGMAWNDINTIYLGGHDNALGAALVYKSADGGNTWNKVFKSTNNQNIYTGWSGYQGDKNWSWGETTFGITVAPLNSDKVVFGDYGFMHVTSDGGANWKQAYVNTNDQHPENVPTPTKQVYHSIGMENTSCWQVFWQSPSNMMAAFSDICGIRSADSGNSWGFNYNGMSPNSIYRIVQTSTAMFAATSDIHDIYQSTHLKDAQLDVNDPDGKIMYSTDNGANWSSLHAFNHPVFWITIDPNNQNKMYASVVDYSGGGSSMEGGIWMTSNLNSLAGSTWVQLPSYVNMQGHPASIIVLNDGKVLASFSGRIAPVNTWTSTSGVFLYDPSSNQWTDVSDGRMHYWTKDIVLDPSDTTQNTWYACVFTHWGNNANGQGGLYRTTNRGGGGSWTKLTGTQFDRVTSISFNPQNYNEAYLTTETQGLWMSSNMNASTPNWTLVNSYSFRQPERVYFNPYNQNEMWVSSFGNGMKMGNLSSTTGLPVFSNNDVLKAYPNPIKDALIIESGLKGRIQVFNMLGLEVYEGQVNIGKQFINTGHFAIGIYIIQFTNNEGSIIKQMKVIKN